MNEGLTAAGDERREQVLPTSELQRSSGRDGVYTAGPVMESFSSETFAKVRPPPLLNGVWCTYPLPSSGVCLHTRGRYE